MRTLARLVTALSCSTAVLAAQCYFPNGDKVNSDTACNPDALVSACCYDNQACLSNGLCVSDPHDPVKARLHRGTCTDANWKSGNCPRQCLGSLRPFCCQSLTDSSQTSITTAYRYTAAIPPASTPTAVTMAATARPTPGPRFSPSHSRQQTYTP